MCRLQQCMVIRLSNVYQYVKTSSFYNVGCTNTCTLLLLYSRAKSAYTNSGVILFRVHGVI